MSRTEKRLSSNRIKTQLILKSSVNYPKRINNSKFRLILLSNVFFWHCNIVYGFWQHISTHDPTPLSRCPRHKLVLSQILLNKSSQFYMTTEKFLTTVTRSSVQLRTPTSGKPIERIFVVSNPALRRDRGRNSKNTRGSDSVDRRLYFGRCLGAFRSGAIFPSEVHLDLNLVVFLDDQLLETLDQLWQKQIFKIKQI